MLGKRTTNHESRITISYRQFLFGQPVNANRPPSPDEIERLIAKGREIRERGPLPSQEKILKVFSQLSKAWLDPAYPRRRQAREALLKNSGLGTELIDLILGEFPRFFTAEALSKKVEGELGSPSIQDEPVLQASTGARLIFRPAGAVLHVASGNAFVACIESIIDGIITKNVNFLKMSSDDRDFPIIFAESIKDFDKESVITPRLAILWWRPGDAAIEDLFKKNMDRIVFWGGYDALLNWKRNLSESTILVQHGPKISFGVISRAGLKSDDLTDLTDRIAFDIVMWEQKACNCPQALFVEDAVTDEEMKDLIGSLDKSLERLNKVFPPAKRSDDEYVEILRARELALAKDLMGDASVSIYGPTTLDWTIMCEDRSKDKRLDLSPLGRTIIVKRYQNPDALACILEGQSFYLQTAGYCLDDTEVSRFALALSSKGVTRLCRFGKMTIPSPGTPHDGTYALRDLTRATVVE